MEVSEQAIMRDFQNSMLKMGKQRASFPNPYLAHHTEGSDPNEISNLQKIH